MLSGLSLQAKSSETFTKKENVLDGCMKELYSV